MERVCTAMAGAEGSRRVRSLAADNIVVDKQSTDRDGGGGAVVGLLSAVCVFR